jgi:hypothetical protein
MCNSYLQTRFLHITCALRYKMKCCKYGVWKRIRFRNFVRYVDSKSSTKELSQIWLQFKEESKKIFKNLLEPII